MDSPTGELVFTHSYGEGCYGYVYLVDGELVPEYEVWSTSYESNLVYEGAYLMLPLAIKKAKSFT